MAIKLMDCTLRDGGNVVGKGFSIEYTKMIIEGLIRANIKTIELGNCMGIGAYKEQGNFAPATDEDYCKAIQPYLGKAEIGMFCGWRNGTQENIDLITHYGLNFLRIGANAGDGKYAIEVIKKVKATDLICRYSMMKAYVLSPEELADEAQMVASAGLDEITIMDSAGTMTPEITRNYVHALKKKISIPVAFHGHNNLGLSVANALAAYSEGAEVFDCGLLGMARSAGNCPTELAVASFQRIGLLQDVDLLALLDFEDKILIPAMEKYNYHVAIKPLDLVLGLAGAHSSFTKMFEDVAEEENVNLYKLILEVSKVNRKNPSESLIKSIADRLKVA